MKKGGEAVNNNIQLEPMISQQSEMISSPQNVTSKKGSKYVSIIATHQARIRCLLSNILGKKIERFMNGAVVRLEINPNNILCTLAHQGELDEVKPEKKYYVTDSTKTSPNYTAVQFPDINVRVQSTYNTNGNTYVFFLIRHGQGTHNTLKGFKKKQAAIFGNKDTRLTDTGFEQAAMTGAKMAKNEEFLSAKHLFSSDLTRTIETLVTVLKQDSSKKIVNTAGGKEIVVLPCSHELNYDPTGNCDGSSKQAVVGNENKPSCKSLSECVPEYDSFKINWNYYSQFYDSGTRINPGKNRKHCRDTKFLQEAIDIVNRREQAINIDMTNPIAQRRGTIGGKKRKTKKNKKLKRKRKTYKRKHRNKKRGTRSRKKKIIKRKRTRSRK